MNSVKNEKVDLNPHLYRFDYQIFTPKNLKFLVNPTGRNLEPALLAAGRTFPIRFLCGLDAYLGTSNDKVPVMIQYSTCDETTACRAFALERNRQLFEEAQALSRCAFEMLEGNDLDMELFDRYQAVRRKADLKFEEAIEHLRLLNEDFPPVSMPANRAYQAHSPLESRA